MNEKIRTAWITKDPTLNVKWRETGMNKREYTRKFAKEIDAYVKEKAAQKLTSTPRSDAPRTDDTNGVSEAVIDQVLAERKAS